jgi:hypothetical protein
MVVCTIGYMVIESFVLISNREARWYENLMFSIASRVKGGIRK